MKNQGFTLAHFAGVILLSIAAFIFFIMPELKRPSASIPTIIAHSENETDEATLLNTADILLMECPNITKYGHDIKEIRMTHSEPSAQAIEQKQWTSAIMAEVVITTSPTDIPAGWKTSGHHCWYSAGMSPIGEWGFYWSKKPCAKLCEIDPQDQSYGYKVIMHSIASEAAQ